MVGFTVDVRVGVGLRYRARVGVRNSAVGLDKVWGWSLETETKTETKCQKEN